MIALEILKTYIKANLASNFIGSSKSYRYSNIIYLEKKW